MIQDLERGWCLITCDSKVFVGTRDQLAAPSFEASLADVLMKTKIDPNTIEKIGTCSANATISTN